MNLSYTDKKNNHSNVLFKYYLNIILISIDGKSREGVHSDLKSRGFRVGHCHVLDIIRKKKKDNQDLYSLELKLTGILLA